MQVKLSPFHILWFNFIVVNLQGKSFQSLELLLLSCGVVSNSFATPWTVAHQAPLSMWFPRQEFYSGLPFPSPMHACRLSCFSCVWPCANPWTAAHQAPLSTEFFRQEYCSGLPFPSPPPFAKSILIFLCLCVFMRQLWLIKVCTSHGHYEQKNEIMHKKHFT